MHEYGIKYAAMQVEPNAPHHSTSVLKETSTRPTHVSASTGSKCRNPNPPLSLALDERTPTNTLPHNHMDRQDTTHYRQSKGFGNMDTNTFNKQYKSIKQKATKT